MKSTQAKAAACQGGSHEVWRRRRPCLPTADDLPLLLLLLLPRSAHLSQPVRFCKQCSLQQRAQLSQPVHFDDVVR
jgi:hypothetical protein